MALVTVRIWASPSFALNGDRNTPDKRDALPGRN